MASIIQKNKSYCVVYSYFEEDGKRKQKWESFKNIGDAKKRLKEVEYKVNSPRLCGQYKKEPW